MQEHHQPLPRFEFGIYTLGDICRDPRTGNLASAHQRIKEIMEAAKFADEAGLDLFGAGEHHRLDFAVTATPVLLSAIAQMTKRIRLTSATTVISTVDPVRLFEDFATLDLISDGRAEIIAGRGAFVESFPLFGYSLDDYDALFTENIQLLLDMNKKERMTWEGRFRSPLNRAEITPRPLQNGLPVWVGVGGSPESAARAGSLGVGMAIAMLGGDPARFKPLVDVYRSEGKRAGHAPDRLQVGVTGHGYLAAASQQAREEFYPYYANYYSCFNPGQASLTRSDFDQLASPDTALFVGSPQEIAEKIIRQHELFGHTRFMAQMDIGGMPLTNVLKAIELLAVEVAPAVRKAIGKQPAAKA